MVIFATGFVGLIGFRACKADTAYSLIVQCLYGPAACLPGPASTAPTAQTELLSRRSTTRQGSSECFWA